METRETGAALIGGSEMETPQFAAWGRQIGCLAERNQLTAPAGGWPGNQPSEDPCRGLTVCLYSNRALWTRGDNGTGKC